MCIDCQCEVLTLLIWLVYLLDIGCVNESDHRLIFEIDQSKFIRPLLNKRKTNRVALLWWSFFSVRTVFLFWSRFQPTSVNSCILDVFLLPLLLLYFITRLAHQDRTSSADRFGWVYCTSSQHTRMTDDLIADEFIYASFNRTETCSSCYFSFFTICTVIEIQTMPFDLYHWSLLAREEKRKTGDTSTRDLNWTTHNRLVPPSVSSAFSLLLRRKFHLLKINIENVLFQHSTEDLTKKSRRRERARKNPSKLLFEEQSN